MLSTISFSRSTDSVLSVGIEHRNSEARQKIIEKKREIRKNSTKITNLCKIGLKPLLKSDRNERKKNTLSSLGVTNRTS